MYSCLFVASLIVILVSGEELYVFSDSESVLVKCIENQLLENDHQYEQDGFVKDFAKMVGRRFHGKSVTKKSFTHRVASFFFMNCATIYYFTNLTQISCHSTFKIELNML